MALARRNTYQMLWNLLVLWLLAIILQPNHILFFDSQNNSFGWVDATVTLSPASFSVVLSSSLNKLEVSNLPYNPACGSGNMTIRFVNCVIDRNIDLAFFLLLMFIDLRDVQQLQRRALASVFCGLFVGNQGLEQKFLVRFLED